MLLGRRRLADSHRNYARRLLVVRDQERALVAGEVHAELVQRLAALRNELSRWRARPEPATGPEILSAEEELVRLGDALREMAHRLHPSVVKKHGLSVALAGLQQELEGAHHFNVRLHLDGRPLPQEDLGHTLYRIIQEALHNVIRHAGVSEATVTVVSAEGTIRIEVRDAGVGFDQSTDRGRGLEGLGLISMGERAALAGGTLEVRSRPGAGTVVRAQVPWSGA